jgi:hypothetical protein
MPDDVTLTTVEFYQVIPGRMVTIEVITGDGQVSGSALLLNGVPHPFTDRSGPQPLGANLAGSILQVNTVVRDINPATNRTSVTYELQGGAQPRQYPYSIEVSAEKGAAHYLIAFVFTTEAV